MDHLDVGPCIARRCIQWPSDTQGHTILFRVVQLHDANTRSHSTWEVLIRDALPTSVPVHSCRLPTSFVRYLSHPIFVFVFV